MPKHFYITYVYVVYEYTDKNKEKNANGADPFRRECIIILYIHTYIQEEPLMEYNNNINIGNDSGI